MRSIVSRLRRTARTAVSAAFAVFSGVLVGLAISLLAAGAVQAQSSDAADSRAVIERQLEAFSRDAWSEAYQFAAPGIQRIFPTPEVFGQMVRNGYPMVWRPADVRFLGAAPEGGYLVQRVRLLDQTGRAYIARYTMERVDGVWRIAGVTIEEDRSSV